jgi:DNA-binding transcriptional ArsR family regulator
MSRNQESLSQDTVFELLSSPRRRFILYYLRRHDGEATIDELTTEIAAWENDLPPEELSRQDEKRVYVSLYQTHIPKFEDEGVINYDNEDGIVQLTDRAGQLDPYLETEEESSLPWQLFYVGIAILGGILYALSLFEVAIFSTVPPIAITAGLVVSIVGLVTIQYAYE